MRRRSPVLSDGRSIAIRERKDSAPYLRAQTVSDVVEDVDSFDGGARTVRLVPEVEAVAELMGVEGSFLIIGLGLGFNTRVESGFLIT